MREILWKSVRLLPCIQGNKGNISFISSGTFDRILDVPKTVQDYEPFLNGTLREVGFGKSFAYKTYTSHSLPLTIFSHYSEIILTLEIH